MATGPAAVKRPVLRLIERLIPPASREEVLGDVHERHGCVSAFEILRVLPYIIISRLRRTTDPVVLLMEALAMFTWLVVATTWLDAPLLGERWGFALLEIPVAILLTTVVLADAYAHPGKRGPLRPLLAPVLGIALTCAVPVLPWIVLIWGGIPAAALVAMLRMVIPPIPDRAQTAKIPAHWQKLELEHFAAGRILLPFAAIVFLLIAFSRWFR